MSHYRHVRYCKTSRASSLTFPLATTCPAPARPPEIEQSSATVVKSLIAATPSANRRTRGPTMSGPSLASPKTSAGRSSAPRGRQCRATPSRHSVRHNASRSCTE
eukprot:5503723-Pyramimonas_sp.AAC.2